MEGNCRKRRKEEEKDLSPKCAAPRKPAPLSAQSVAIKMEKKILIVSSHDIDTTNSIKSSLTDQVQVKAFEEVRTESEVTYSCVVFLQKSPKIAAEIDDWCQANSISFIWGLESDGLLTLFSRPSQVILESFLGENSRPENDLLISEDISKEENFYRVKCSKKHYIVRGYVISMKEDNQCCFAEVIQVESDKTFCAKVIGGDESLNCDDSSYVIKIWRRNDSQYVSLRESLLSESIHFEDSQEEALHRKFKENLEELPKASTLPSLKRLLGSIIGAEITSTIIGQSRLPTSQWAHFDCSSSRVESCEKVEKIFIVGGECQLAEALQAKIGSTITSTITAYQDVKNVELDNSIVITAGGAYENRSNVAEHCKANNVRFIDCGASFQEGHIQTIYPKLSALFDSIVDFEDLSEEAPHCVTKSFPSNLDHCIQWSTRKVSSWKKEKPNENENLSEKAKAKFTKHFIDKPKTLLKNFPVEENPDTWKKPKRVPKIDVQLDLEKEPHKLVYQSLVSLYQFRAQNSEDDEDGEIILPESLEKDLTISLTKMRSFVYGIRYDLESDEEIYRRANRRQACPKATCSIIASLVAFEIEKLGLGLQRSDWWVSERAGFRVLGSRNCPEMRTMGKIKMSPWDSILVDKTENWTLQELLDHLEEVVGLGVDIVIQNGKPIFIKMMPTHVNKKKKMVKSLFKFNNAQKASIYVSFTNDENLCAVEIIS